jgi:hypothetical protein
MKEDFPFSKDKNHKPAGGFHDILDPVYSFIPQSQLFKKNHPDAFFPDKGKKNKVTTPRQAQMTQVRQTHRPPTTTILYWNGKQNFSGKDLFFRKGIELKNLQKTTSPRMKVPYNNFISKNCKP